MVYVRRGHSIGEVACYGRGYSLRSPDRMGGIIIALAQTIQPYCRRPQTVRGAGISNFQPETQQGEGVRVDRH